MTCKTRSLIASATSNSDAPQCTTTPSTSLMVTSPDFSERQHLVMKGFVGLNISDLNGQMFTSVYSRSGNRDSIRVLDISHPTTSEPFFVMMSESRYLPLSPDAVHGNTVSSPSNCLRSMTFSLNRTPKSPKIPLVSSLLMTWVSHDGSGGTTSTISISMMLDRSGACTNVTCLSTPVKMTVFTSPLQSCVAVSIKSARFLIFSSFSYFTICLLDATVSSDSTFCRSPSPLFVTWYSKYSIVPSSSFGSAIM